MATARDEAERGLSVRQDAESRGREKGTMDGDGRNKQETKESFVQIEARLESRSKVQVLMDPRSAIVPDPRMGESSSSLTILFRGCRIDLIKV